ncbi:hypothetical protein SNE40_012244 [Patella caerulea]|uniref:Uncharacterized protein n=1 Tax=Patella caerulea TaxID=87958 RepID=A0AAN8JPI1_PATCE
MEKEKGFRDKVIEKLYACNDEVEIEEELDADIIDTDVINPVTIYGVEPPNADYKLPPGYYDFHLAPTNSQTVSSSQSDTSGDEGPAQKRRRRKRKIVQTVKPERMTIATTSLDNGQNKLTKNQKRKLKKKRKRDKLKDENKCTASSTEFVYKPEGS